MNFGVAFFPIYALCVAPFAYALGRLAAHLEAHQEGAHLGRRGVARGHDVERPLGLAEREALAVADLGQKAAKIVDVAAQTLAPICPLPAGRQDA